MNRRRLRNIGFIGTRIAGTDGVSLEIEKWAQVLDRNRYNCFYFAGRVDRDGAVSKQVDEAHFEHPEIAEISRRVFGVNRRSRETSKRIQDQKGYLKRKLYDFIDRFEIDLIIPENALTIPMNIPLGLAVTELIGETAIPTIAHHHDFYWERDRFLINACQDYLNKSFPPDLPSIRHVVINSLASKQLSYRLGISNTIIPNVYDFANEPEELPSPEGIRRQVGLEKPDLFILQPTRIVARKWIERSIEVVRNLRLKNPRLVISHATGDEGADYYQRVMEYADNMGVKIVPCDHLIGSNQPNSQKTYSIDDIYRSADLVTYPSGYEGFGNAFLEAVYFKKPIVVNRYSIYIVDIEPKGFDVLALNGFVTGKVIDRIRHLFSDKDRIAGMVKTNYDLAEKYFSYEVLENKLLYILSTFP